MSDTYCAAIMGIAPFGSTRPQLHDVPDFVPQHDPREPVNSPYYIKPPLVEVVDAPVEPVVELSPGQRARAFLVEQLTPDPVPSLNLQARAKAAGIAWRTIRNVQKAIGVKVFKDKAGPWMWSLREED
jgi:hypothetical protein